MSHDPFKLLPRAGEEESFDLNELYRQEVGELPPHLDTPLPRKRGLVIYSLDKIEKQPVEWLWHGRIPLGKLTLLVGTPDAGKSFLTIALAAHLSRGDQLPGNPEPIGPFESLVIEMEDGIADTVKPRAELCGAIMERVHVANSVVVRGDIEVPFGLPNVDELDSALTENPSIKLVVINPLGAVMGSEVNDYREQDVRRELAKLEALARKHNVAILAVKHFNKRNPDEGGRGLNRIAGSVAFVGLVRSVLGIATDGNRRHVFTMKSNLSAPPPAVAFTITDHGLMIESEDLDYCAPGESPARESRVEACISWLRAILTAGSVPSADLTQRAIDAGFPRRTLARAREQLGVMPSRSVVDGKPVWVTTLPSERPETQDAATVCGQATGQHAIDIAA